MKGSFGRFVRERRLALGIKQTAPEDLLGRSRGHMARIEAGDLYPPEREECHRLAALLQVEPELLWRIAARELMERVSPGMWAWHEEQVMNPTSIPAGPLLSADEERLILALRARGLRSTLEAIAGIEAAAGLARELLTAGGGR